MPDETRRAWLAGIFDGEGCIHLQSNRSPQSTGLRVTIPQKHHAFIYNLQKMIGGHIEQGNNNSWVVALTAKEEIEAFLRYICPYVILKREELEYTLVLLAFMPGRGRRLSAEQLERKKLIEDRLREALRSRREDFIYEIQDHSNRFGFRMGTLDILV